MHARTYGRAIMTDLWRSTKERTLPRDCLIRSPIRTGSNSSNCWPPSRVGRSSSSCFAASIREQSTLGGAGLLVYRPRGFVASKAVLGAEIGSSASERSRFGSMASWGISMMALSIINSATAVSVRILSASRFTHSSGGASRPGPKRLAQKRTSGSLSLWSTMPNASSPSLPTAFISAPRPTRYSAQSCLPNKAHRCNGRRSCNRAGSFRWTNMGQVVHNEQRASSASAPE